MSAPEPHHEFQARAAHYQEYLAEREAVLQHKWLLSQRDEREYSWEEALLDWVAQKRTTWKKDRHRKH